MGDQYINKKQKLLVENVLSDRTVLPKVYHILESSYFAPPLDRVINFVTDYFKEYKSVPSFRDVDAETDVSLEQQEQLDESDVKYTVQELETHCRQEAIKKAILESISDVETNNIHSIESRIKKAISIKVDNDIGLDYFYEDAISRLSDFKETLDAKSTGYESIDDLLGGGIRRGDLVIFAGTTGVGKSIIMSNLGNNYSKEKEDVLIISLELNQELTALRLDSIILGVGTKDVFKNIDEIQNSLEYIREDRGSIVIKYLPFKTTPSEIEALLLEYQIHKGKYPDTLVLDYIDEMSTGTSADRSIHEKEGELTGDIKRICEEYSMRGITAAQLVKDVDDITKLTKSSVSGSNAKTARCDFCIGIVATDADIDNNRIQMTQIKARSGGKRSENKIMYMNPNNLRLTDDEIEGHENPFVSKLKKEENNNIESEKSASERLKNLIKTM